MAGILPNQELAVYGKTSPTLLVDWDDATNGRSKDPLLHPMNEPK